MGTRSEVALARTDRLTPRSEDLEQFVDVTAECVERGAHLQVGGDLDLLPRVTALQ